MDAIRPRDQLGQVLGLQAVGCVLLGLLGCNLGQVGPVEQPVGLLLGRSHPDSLDRCIGGGGNHGDVAVLEEETDAHHLQGLRDDDVGKGLEATEHTTPDVNLDWLI